jgi:O-antigen/teichoic acid export membrane protein
MTQLDRFFISKILGFEALGIYVAVSVVIITIFNLMSTSIGFVLMPYLAKGRKINKKNLIFFIILIVITLSLFFLFFTQKMNHIFYNGRYDGYQNLINLFIIIGALQFIYNFIYFSLGGIGEKIDFIRFFFSIGISIIVFIVLSLILIPKLNILGAAITTAVSWLIRDIGGIMILRKKRIHV